MPRRMYQIVDVHRGLKGWTVLVQVVEHSHVQLSRGTPPRRYKKLLLTDSSGTKVSGVIYGNDIRYFANFLTPFKRYFVSNATLNYTALPFRVSNYEFSWIINNTTLVEEVPEAVVPPLPCTFELTNFAEFYKYADTEKSLNIKGIVLHAFPSREQGSEERRIRDFVIVNEEKRPMILTLWNEFEEYDGTNIAAIVATAPVIIAMRLKVTTFNSLSLSTRMSSSILLNPPLPDEMQLKDWYNANKDELKLFVETKAYKDSTRLLPPPSEQDIISIQAALTILQDAKTSWVKGRARLVNGQQKYWYTACANCHKSVHADVDWDIKCPSCKEETKVIVRCRIEVVLEEDGDMLTATMFSPDCEKVIPFTAPQLKEADDNGVMLDGQIAATVERFTIVAFLRYYEREYQGQTVKKYTVVKAYTTDEMIQLAQGPGDEETVEATLPIIDEEMPTISLQIQTPEALTAKSNNVERQLFTPSTKTVLEEIAATSDAFTSTASTIGVKRNLNFLPEFTDIGSSHKMQDAELDDDSGNNQQPTSVRLEESPSKKNRDKVKLS